MAFIDIRSVSKTFGKFQAVRGVSLSVPEGKLMGVLGPSGCGKTTLLRLIAGFERPDSGEIVIGGQSVAHLPAWQRNIGVVFQNYALFPFLSVEANVAFGLEQKKVARSEIRDRVDRVLKIVGLEGFNKRMPRQLSGGQAQRVALARAIVYQPDILLLDEPLSALDARLRDDMRFEIQRIQAETGVTTMFVTHDQNEALAISDSIVLLNRGEVCQLGAPKDIWDKPRTRFAGDFLGIENIFDCAPDDDGGYALTEDSTTVGGALIPSASMALGPGVTAVGLRGRDIEFAELAAEAGLTVTGRIVGIGYLGHEWIYEVQTPHWAKPLTVLSSERLAPGQPVTLSLPFKRFIPLAAD